VASVAESFSDEKNNFIEHLYGLFSGGGLYTNTTARFPVVKRFLVGYLMGARSLCNDAALRGGKK